jgi:pyrroline-5-carboxylate reductase
MGESQVERPGAEGREGPQGGGPLRVAVLGAGQLGRALLTGLAGSDGGPRIELAASTRRPCDPGPGVRGVSLEEDPRANNRLASWADIVVLAVKPTQTMPLVEDIADDVRPGSAVVTLAIGVTASAIQSALPAGVDVVRAMPNLAVEVRRAVTGLSPGPGAREEGVRRVRELFGLLGAVVEVPDERLDVLSMVSGAGPAYVCFLIEEFTAAARCLGFEEETARALVGETFHGAMALLEAPGRTASSLLSEIASEGSATERAIATLAQSAIAEHAEQAMQAAVARAAELGASIYPDPAPN